MIARRLRLTILASVCGMVCVFAAGVVPTVAGAIKFGGEGEGSGKLREPWGLAIDQATREVYVADEANDRVDKFGSSGSFLATWGWGVDEGGLANELQTCTAACQRGSAGQGAGQFAGGPRGMAVDNDPLSISFGDVYAADPENNRVEKFSASGEFILMIGGGVNKTSGGNVCMAGEECQRGSQGTADGQFEDGEVYIAVGPGGAVYVGDEARVQVFEQSGAWKENISLSSLSSTGQVTSLAVDSAGDVYVKDSEVSGVREFEPSGVEKSMQFDAGSESVEAVALDASGDVFVADASGGLHFLEYDSAGKELASFGSHTAQLTLAWRSRMRLVSCTCPTAPSDDVWVLPLPAPGPLLEAGSESATPGQRGTATLEATINPEGDETSYHFEYVDEARFEESGYASASSTHDRRDRVELRRPVGERRSERTGPRWDLPLSDRRDERETRNDDRSGRDRHADTAGADRRSVGGECGEHERDAVRKDRPLGGEYGIPSGIWNRCAPTGRSSRGRSVKARAM